MKFDPKTAGVFIFAFSNIHLHLRLMRSPKEFLGKVLKYSRVFFSHLTAGFSVSHYTLCRCCRFPALPASKKGIAIIHDISAHHRLLRDYPETFDVRQNIEEPGRGNGKTSLQKFQGRFPHPHAAPRRLEDK